MNGTQEKLQSESVQNVNQHIGIKRKVVKNVPEKISSRVKDKRGNRYGRLYVVKLAYIGKPEAVWHCVCDCGETTFVRGTDLRRGATRSCGCLFLELKTKHGYCHHKLYKIWSSMVGRCVNKNNQSYKNYGGRGIFVCDEWRERPESFIKWALDNGWKDGLHLDRRENDSGYCPRNCRFIKQGENNLNQRMRKDNSTNFVGVYRKGKGYFASIGVNKKRIYLGCFSDSISAARARNDYIISNNLKHKLNIIS